VIKVNRIDMYDGTPVIDIKPYVEYERGYSVANCYSERFK